MASKKSSGPPQKKQKTETSGTEDKVMEYLEKLDKVQDKIEKLNEEAAEEIIKVEKKYVEKKDPLYDERAEFIKNIPDFWKKTFQHHDVMGDCLSELDQSILDYLVDLKVKENTDTQGFKITFIFKTNPYFKNTELHKEAIFSEVGEIKMTASEIDWHPGKNPLESSEEDPPESFFAMWFKRDAENSGDPDEVAELIKDEIWPDPAKFYHGFEIDEEGEEEEA